MPQIVFITPDGTRHTLDAREGHSLLRTVQDHGFDELEGTCEGSLACATCHVVVDPAWDPKLPPPSDDENDMLDMTPTATETSRLSCQISLTKELDGLVVRAPEPVV